VLVPLYTHCLSQDDYGVLEVLTRLAETLGLFLMVSGLREALMTFYQQSERDIDRARVASAVLVLMLGMLLLGGGLVALLGGPLSVWLQAQSAAINPGLVQLAVLSTLLEPLTLFPLTLFQARMRSLSYALVILSQLTLRLTLTVILVYGLQWGVRGVLTATLLTTGIYGICLSGRELLRSSAWPDWGRMVGLLRFALPFLPGGLCFFVLHHGDRFFLLYWRNEAEVGIYALGYKLGCLVTLFGLNPLYQVWSARMYQVARTPEAPEVFGQTFTRILTVYLAIGLALGLFQNEVVAILAPGYAAAVPIILPVVLAMFLYGGARLMDAGFYITRRTEVKLVITVLATLVMLALYAILIPQMGGLGGALATLGGFACHAAGTWYVTQRLFPVRYEWGRLLGVLLLAAGLWLVSLPLPCVLWAAPLKAALWLLFPVLLWQTGLTSEAEKQYAAHLIRQAATRWLYRRTGKAIRACPELD
jgi:O-antigen/teichoic acid export membrane protein